jgi:hypothetical protein
MIFSIVILATPFSLRKTSLWEEFMLLVKEAVGVELFDVLQDREWFHRIITIIKTCPTNLP